MRFCRFAIVATLLVACAHCKPHEVHEVQSKNAQQEAELALRNDRAADYARPFSNKPRDRNATASLFRESCLQGDTRACRMAALLSPNDEVSLKLVASNCRAGDAMSCRALPLDDKQSTYPNEPGAAGRSSACQSDGPSCDHEAIKRECEGFPNSCAVWRSFDPDDPRPVDLENRLTEIGCKNDVVSECGSQLVDEERRICELTDQCWSLAQHEEGRGHLVAARDAWERQCQYTHFERLGACLELGEKYVTKVYAEPDPDRGWKLLRWACPQIKKEARQYVVPKHPHCQVVLDATGPKQTSDH